uniref:Glucose-methanol-choline oxidoreductase N-terminal domain-containing protein n=1 Tax=Populus trichocarpa TaxID=3694 RepID=A0A2K1YD51_POPTR
MSSVSSAPHVLYYDYIVIGGGTSGCPLAATLSQGASVLVLERGGSPYGNPKIMNIANFADSLSDTSPNSASQQFISDDGVYNARARVLGGESALNAGFYTHASVDYMRKAGWNPEFVDESYAWVENKVAFEPPMLQWQSAVRDGLIEVGVLPYNGFTYDHIHGTKVGGSIFDKYGHGHTAADLLEYAEPRNISVYLHATVHKILFTETGKPWPRPRAYGVVFEDSSGLKHWAYLGRSSKNEIIISAGALGSPQLLMLSGIGPANHLQAHGISVVVDQPMTGQPSAMTAEAMYRAIETLNSLVTETLQGGVILEKIIGPVCTGELKLRTTNPHDNPSVKFNYFKEPEDLNSIFKIRHKDMPVQALIDLMVNLPVNLRPRHFSTAISLEQFCTDTVMTIWHYHGGCQVRKVVDNDYKVLGVDKLRVIDGSTFIDSPGTNPQATVMLLGRYMGRRILYERLMRGRK